MLASYTKYHLSTPHNSKSLHIDLLLTKKGSIFQQKAYERTTTYREKIRQENVKKSYPSEYFSQANFSMRQRINGYGINLNLHHVPTIFLLGLAIFFRRAWGPLFGMLQPSSLTLVLFSWWFRYYCIIYCITNFIFYVHICMHSTRHASIWNI